MADAPTFTIQILEHDGSVAAELENPIGLQYEFNIGANGPDKCQWSLAESDEQVYGVLDGIETMPYKRDFRLLGDGFPVMAGFIDSVNMPLRGNELNFVGQGWLKWLDQDWRAYYATPMNYDDDIDAVVGANDPAEFHAFFSLGATLTDWVEAILAPLSEDAGEQVILTPLYSGTAFDEALIGQIERATGRTGLSLLQELAAMGNPYGFDFWVEHNKELNLVGPRQTDPLSVFPIAEMTQSSGSFLGDDFDVSPIIDGDWTNNGPLGTDILFLDGLSNAARYYRKQHQPSVDQFRRWGANATIGERGGRVTIGTKTESEFKAAAASYRMMFPQRELSLQVKPELFSFNRQLLQPIAVDYQKFPGSFRRINASFWVTKQAYRETSPGSGDWICDLSLDQIYEPI